ncbi:hypothetical protein ILYODFUR_013401 [Ilyodon furcidens]|uniref:UBL3-like ubiquitin domain-containing protein n=1 Tax=Ilyodon furcidens TaxID=33524 RepID=A0ABV0SKW2_9TELE
MQESRIEDLDWEEEQVSSPNILRLIYQGRFLHGNVTLGALKLPLGRTTVMHLVARETLPEPNSQGQRNREKTGESNCCVILLLPYPVTPLLAIFGWSVESVSGRLFVLAASRCNTVAKFCVCVALLSHTDRLTVLTTKLMKTSM